MYRVSDTVRSTHGQDGGTVLDIRQGQMFNLNLVGSLILQLLDQNATQQEIVDKIVQEFGVSRHLVENDLQQFLDTLEKHRLVESTD